MKYFIKEHFFEKSVAKSMRETKLFKPREKKLRAYRTLTLIQGPERLQIDVEGKQLTELCLGYTLIKAILPIMGSHK